MASSSFVQTFVLIREYENALKAIKQKEKLTYFLPSDTWSVELGTTAKNLLYLNVMYEDIKLNHGNHATYQSLFDIYRLYYSRPRQTKIQCSNQGSGKRTGKSNAGNELEVDVVLRLN